jgi:hypothetical protein
MDPYVVYERQSHCSTSLQNSFQHDEFDFLPQLSEKRTIDTMLFDGTGAYLASHPALTSPTSRYIGEADTLPPDPEIWYNKAHQLHAPSRTDPRMSSPGAYSSYSPSPGYPHHDPEDWESQSSGTRSHSVVNADELHSPNSLSQPYYGTQQCHWNSTGYAASLPIMSPPQLSHAGSSFVIPSQVENAPTPAAVHHENHDETMSDIDAEGEDDTTLLGTDDLPLTWPSLPDHPTPGSRESHTGPSSDEGAGSENDSEYQDKPIRHHRKSSNSKRPISTTTRSGRPSRRPNYLAPASAKASERTSPGRLSKTKNNSWSKKAAADGAKGPFYCPLAPYGCGSTFPNKNEWKRHTTTQHVKQGFWRCTLCLGDGSGTFNEFNRKDLFVQHIQRMHRDNLEININELASNVRVQLQNDELENELRKEFHKGKDRVKEEYWVRSSVLADYGTKCWVQLRKLPQRCICPICNSKEFHGNNAWNDRMEHMATHFECIQRSGSGSGSDNKHKPPQWRDDEALRDYLDGEGLISMDGNGAWRLGDGIAKN